MVSTAGAPFAGFETISQPRRQATAGG